MGLSKFLLFSLLTLGESLSTSYCLYQDNTELSVVRSYMHNSSLLVVNTKSLETSLIKFPNILDFKYCQKDSNYERLKKKALSHSNRLANRGLKEGVIDAYAITVDMCPSSKASYDRELFDRLKNEQKPVTISMTYKWALYHPKEFLELKSWDDNKSLDITWMNHGHWHPYERNVTLDENFINLPDVNFTKEVLANERFLVDQGRTPSIFYRFAGLVSNDKAYKKLISKFGLLPIGTKAWLAKGEKIRSGSIVLLHGNKNEPKGLKAFYESKSKLPVVELPQLFQKQP
jgi:hypothetical protein